MNTSDYLVGILKASYSTMSLDHILAICAQNEKHLTNKYAMSLLRRSDVKINYSLFMTPKGKRWKVISYEYLPPEPESQSVPELVNESLLDMFGELLTKIGFKVVAAVTIPLGCSVLWSVWSIMEWMK